MLRAGQLTLVLPRSVHLGDLIPRAKVVRILLNAGADIEARDEESNGRQMPLHLAAARGNVDVVTELIAPNVEANGGCGSVEGEIFITCFIMASFGPIVNINGNFVKAALILILSLMKILPTKRK